MTTPAESRAWCAGNSALPGVSTGQIVEAHELHAGLHQVGGRVLGEVDVVGLELGAQQLAGHARLEEDAQVVTEVDALEVGSRSHPIAAGQVDHAGLAQEDLEGKLVHRGPVGQEVIGSVDVGSRLGAQGHAGEVVGLSFRDPVTGLEGELGVAGIHGNVRRQRNRHIDDLGHGGGREL